MASYRLSPLTIPIKYLEKCEGWMIIGFKMRGRWWYMSSDEPGLHSYADMQHQDKTQKLYNEETN